MFAGDLQPGHNHRCRLLTASTDQIVAARPDLVIAAVPYQEKAVTEILKSGSRFLVWHRRRAR
jgi:hypothetical protein